MIYAGLIALLFMQVSGPFIIVSEDIDLDGKKDDILWSQMVHPVISADDIKAVTWDVEIWVKTKGKIDLIGKFIDITMLDRFWMTHKSSGRKVLVFKVLQRGLNRYVGINRSFKFFDMPAEAFQ
jgi:hypothetical protein